MYDSLTRYLRPMKKATSALPQSPVLDLYVSQRFPCFVTCRPVSMWNVSTHLISTHGAVTAPYGSPESLVCEFKQCTSYALPLAPHINALLTLLKNLCITRKSAKLKTSILISGIQHSPEFKPIRVKPSGKSLNDIWMVDAITRHIISSKRCSMCFLS